jgi:hypothetical protein
VSFCPRTVSRSSHLFEQNAPHDDEQSAEVRVGHGHGGSRGHRMGSVGRGSGEDRDSEARVLCRYSAPQRAEQCVSLYYLLTRRSTNVIAAGRYVRWRRRPTTSVDAAADERHILNGWSSGVIRIMSRIGREPNEGETPHEALRNLHRRRAGVGRRV